MTKLNCFKTYDVRGKIGDELNPKIVKQICAALLDVLQPRSVVLAWDARPDSEAFALVVQSFFQGQGIDILLVGLGGTEEVYFWCGHNNADLGIMITASHNPITDNGMKFAGKGAAPLADEEFQRVRERATDYYTGKLDLPMDFKGRGEVVQLSKDDYVTKLLNFVDLDVLKPLTIVTNPGNGTAGLVIDKLAPHLPFKFVRLHHEPDSSFPHGIPNPMLEENRLDTSRKVIESGADLGVAWDGDFDRCFFFDHLGHFVEGYYIVGLLAEALLQKSKDECIVYEPRLIWNTEEVVQRLGGKAVPSKTGHAFIKATMRKHNAVYGGEMSAHHYFRDFYYCDSGQITWLLVVSVMSLLNISLHELVEKAKTRFPISGEINFMVTDANAAIDRLRERYEPLSSRVDELDGFSAEMKDWRFNVRKSNTEPLVRLNVESRHDVPLLNGVTKELCELLNNS